VIRKINFNLLILILFLTACSSVPKNTNNSCAIFEDRYLWYKHTKKVEEKWGIPVYIQLAFIKKESNYNFFARPPRHKLFKVIPYKRKSSSFGYSQAIKSSWNLYRKETGNKLALRTSFRSSVDFVGWYLNKSHKILKIPKNDAYKLYLSYYLGWSDYKNYSKDKKAIIYAKSVKDIASKYRKQLTTCRDQLNRKKYIIY
tara:strand:- start:3897 stop:4496 length:600 start_codon:yes stop_codon:yes gene_type:complete